MILTLHTYICVDESVINSDSSWFVNFYSPMCSHCHDLAPTWKEVAKLLDGIVKIAAVNCNYNRQLCHQVGIRVYPTLVYYQKVYMYAKRCAQFLFFRYYIIII